MEINKKSGNSGEDAVEKTLRNGEIVIYKTHLGKGTFGQVKKGKIFSQKRIVAVKMISKK